MTLEQQTFLSSINSSYSKYIKEHLTKRGVSKENFIFDMYTIIYLRLYIIMLNSYFIVYSLDDLNFITEEEIQFILDRANEILGTSYTVDFEITGISELSLVWDDVLIWDDSAIWVD